MMYMDKCWQGLSGASGVGDKGDTSEGGWRWLGFWYGGIEMVVMVVVDVVVMAVVVVKVLEVMMVVIVIKVVVMLETENIVVLV
ncbi:hypothetical protein TanjilG_31619 [Lupinus angustifolius]|uniref:Transmembrane protein n=1 Tax=Lupinus angustifolius TaxID=3871 RepID=A0A1J7HYQ1_LUPAN|nr:hypothetical protein TanjilG_31619 [Lupinus angustifolius]